MPIAGSVTGAIPAGNADANVYFRSADSGYFVNSISEFSQARGIYIFNGSPEISDSTIQNNGSYGLHVKGSGHAPGQRQRLYRQRPVCGLFRRDPDFSAERQQQRQRQRPRRFCRQRHGEGGPVLGVRISKLSHGGGRFDLGDQRGDAYCSGRRGNQVRCRDPTERLRHLVGGGVGARRYCLYLPGGRRLCGRYQRRWIGYHACSR